MRLKDKKTNGILTVKLILTACEGLEDHEVETLYGEPITLATLNKYCVDAPEEKKYGGRVPKDGATFYYIAPAGAIIKREWADGGSCESMFEYGSAFWTEEEAEKELARREAYAILKEDTKGFKPNWGRVSMSKYTVYYDHQAGSLSIDEYSCYQELPSDLIFATHEDAKASIEAHSFEWKTWLGVEDE